MKTSHWIGALVALVLMVFFVTFFTNYTGRGTTTEDDTPAADSDAPEPGQLTFLIRSYPYVARTGTVVAHYELEHRKPGHQDYWFFNPNDEAIRLGAVKKSCKCQGVEVFVLPEGAKARLLLAEPNPNVALGLGLLGRRAMEQFTEGTESTADLEAAATAHVELNPDDQNAEAVVPGQRAGWVRMRWTGEKPGRQKLTVQLWQRQPTSGLDIYLERDANFVDPVRVSGNEQALGKVHVKDLPRSVSFYVWSSTRRSFHITKAEPVRLAGLPPEADAFVVGKPVPLTDDQCTRAAMALRMQEVQILCAYRIPVTLQSLAPDGKTAIDIGNFRRRVEVTTDAFDKPVSMAFSGVVRGNLEVQGVDEAGGISFGSFRHDDEPSRVVFVRSDDPTMKLELDKNRVPHYLQALLSEEPAASGQGKTWKLELKVTGSAYGPFPRDDDPEYRDSAVYVRSVGASPQSIRVAVRGDARDR